MKDIMIGSFNRIALLEDKWDHNQQYSKLVLKEIKPGMERTLDIGCGTGEFTKKIAMMTREVIAIDIADQMISEAGTCGHPARIDLSDAGTAFVEEESPEC